MGADDEWREDSDSLPADETKELYEEISLLDEIEPYGVAVPNATVHQTLLNERDDSESPAKGDPTPTEKKEKIGGFSFYLSLLALLPTGVLSVILTLYTWDEETLINTYYFLAAGALGALLAKLFIRAHFSVLLHEFKHQIVSNLVGNKSKALHVEAGSGHFEYSYTKRTRHFHAFISLAPYILPLCTFVASLSALAVAQGDHLVAVGIVGVGYGADLLLNMRDISPIQTDINEIRGGYGIGLLYIAAWNLLIFGVLLAWVFHGLSGFTLLLAEFSALFFYMHQGLGGRVGG